MKKFLFTFIAIMFVIAGYIFVKTTTTKIPSDRLSYSTGEISFRYPEKFWANVWKAETRPPKVSIVQEGQNIFDIGCPILKDGTIITESGGGKFGNIGYSFYRGEDAGAGSLDTTLCYVFSGTLANYVLDFDIRSHTGCENGNCGAYCETEFEQECRDFDLTRDVVYAIEKIISTITIK